MPKELKFTREHALEAIRQTNKKGIDWLYENNPAPKGGVKKAKSGFVFHEGREYPAKQLGRLASKIAKAPLNDKNPLPRVFLKHFRDCGLITTKSGSKENDAPSRRYRKFLSVAVRPEQTKFRKEVLEYYGDRCVVTGSKVLECIEAAHLNPVANGGTDRKSNGVPMRADIHRLFDANLLKINPSTWKIEIKGEARKAYPDLHGKKLKQISEKTDLIEKIAKSLIQRSEFMAQSSK